ncbi:MAG: hypothetical protein ACE5Q6_22880 [Dehalococcoidia bacterium]
MTSKRDLLSAKPRVINVGLESFVESLQAHDAPVVQLDWQPPAGGDSRMMSLLQQLQDSRQEAPKHPSDR